MASSSHATSSNAIAIPQRRKSKSASSGSLTGSSGPGAYEFQYGSFASVASSSASSNSPPRRRESLMSANFSKAEHTVINVGEEECPRLITCVKASQGFDWNQEIFLPSYADYHFDDLERRQDPVQDIIVTDEEVGKMFPK